MFDAETFARSRSCDVKAEQTVLGAALRAFRERSQKVVKRRAQKVCVWIASNHKLRD
jgi:hypothetical protein